MSNVNSAPPESSRAKLKIGLIVDSELVSKYVYELAEWAKTQENLFISHFLLQKSTSARIAATKDNIRSGWQKTLSGVMRRRFLALITRFEHSRLRGEIHFKDHLKLADLKEIVPESITITPLISKEGLALHYSTEDIQKIRDLRLDLLIHCGSGILTGEILESSRLGIVLIIHGDDRTNRCGPPGFWEVHSKQDHTGFKICQLTEEGERNILFRGSTQTRPYFLLNQAVAFVKSYFYLRQLIRTTAVTGELPAALDSQPDFHPLSKSLGSREELKYILNFVISATLTTFGRIVLKKNIRFGVAYMKCDWKSLVMCQARKIETPANHFLADPFVIREGDRDFCFLEDYDYKISRGFICAYELKEDTAERLGEVIVEPFHLSFPYLFRYESKLYMCPECSENKDIRVYECVDFPLKWKLSKILMSNISAVDTMIFERDGLWWLFTNIDPTNTGRFESELFIFYSDNPLGDEWHPHPKNPVLMDSTKGRNGGILYDDKWVYRVAQKQGFKVYGKEFSINKITVLNKYEYEETEVCAAEPKFFPGLIGCHHLHSNGDITVFDYLALRETTQVLRTEKNQTGVAE